MYIDGEWITQVAPDTNWATGTGAGVNNINYWLSAQAGTEAGTSVNNAYFKFFSSASFTSYPNWLETPFQV